MNFLPEKKKNFIVSCGGGRIKINYQKRKNLIKMLKIPLNFFKKLFFKGQRA